MSHRTLIAAGLMWSALLAPGGAAAQAPADAKAAKGTTAWSPPRTGDGQPDLQGVWLSNSASPLERPKALEGRALLSDEEVAEFRRRAHRLFRNSDSDFAAGDAVFQAVLTNPERYVNPNATHSSAGMADFEFDNRTSLIVDPPDGRIPPLTPEGRMRQEAVAAAFQRPAAAADVGNALRCISWSVPRLGGRYGAGDLSYYQIVQAPGFVVLYAETGHEARIIPLDGRPHLPQSLRQWNGDSRGRWEGDTLVVETTNFSSKSHFMGSAEHLHVEERFTRIAPDIITYEIALTDRTTWTRPWRAMMPLRQRTEILYEFACHEGNFHIMSGILAGARAQEDAARGPARADRTVAGEFITEPPTLISLGFEWVIQGDDNRNAEVAVSYRKKGTGTWKPGLPLLRLQRERIDRGPLQYTTPNMFAGSLFDLEPGTEYETRFVLTDPDGVEGKTEQLAAVRTRVEPKPFAGGRVYHVYPPGFTGTKQEPAFTGLLAAYYTGSSHSDNHNTFPPRVQPGDTILVHAGLYKDDRLRYGGGAGLGTISDGTYFLTQNGTPDKPIVIKGAGDGEVVFDGDGAHNLFDVMAASHNYFEGLTIRNTDVAFLAGRKNITGSSGLTIKNCRFENIGRGVLTDWSGSKDFYIADNVFVGRQDANQLIGTAGRTWQKFPEFPPKLLSEYAVKVYGSGHVVAYNAIANFHDGVDHATYGNPDGAPHAIRDRLPVSIDFYNNDIINVDDNCIEADGAAHNVRIFRNRCFNHGHRALSAQPVFGGPAYYIRNLVYHAPEGGALKTSSTPAGLVVYHNTFVAPVRWMLGPISNLHFRNNLILGRSEAPELFAVDTFTNYSTSDYNGFRPNEDAEFSFQWISPPSSTRADYAGKRETRNFKTLEAFSGATGQDTHSILVDYDVFQKASAPDPSDPRRLYKPADFDFRLRPGSKAVDAGIRLPNINDDLTGGAPDLGAYETGQPLPHYGPRR